MELTTIITREVIKYVDWPTLLNLRLVVRFDFEAFLEGDGKRFIKVYTEYHDTREVRIPRLPNGVPHGVLTSKVIDINDFHKEESESLDDTMRYVLTINKELYDHILQQCPILPVIKVDIPDWFPKHIVCANMIHRKFDSKYIQAPTPNRIDSRYRFGVLME
jgi:hypothetical protein